MSARFDVTTVTGYRINMPIGERSGPTGAVGLSAHVIDRLDNCRVVATFRSEELSNRVLPIRRHAETYQRAAAHCEELNERYG